MKDGGPAFPQLGADGLTIRDYFAAKAMQGIISATTTGTGRVQYDDDIVAESAYEMADAMLAAREK